MNNSVPENFQEGITTDANKKPVHSKKEEALKQLRRRLSDCLSPDDTDVILLKWLRAANFDLLKCEKLYRKNESTKKIHKLDKLEEIFKVPEVMYKYEFSNLMGSAKDGTPVRYIALGRGDIQGFIRSADIFDNLKFCSLCVLKDIQMCKENSSKFGREINEVIYVVDMDQFSLKQVLDSTVVEFGWDSFKILQEHHPEIWKYILVIRAPSYFYTAFNIFKPIFGHTFLQNIMVVSKEFTPQLLLKYIDADVLPAFLGGKRLDVNGSPKCEEFMKFGGEIPHERYLCNVPPSITPKDPEVLDIWVNPRSFYNYVFVTHEADSVVRVEIRTQKSSINTYVLFKELSSNSGKLKLPTHNENVNEYEFAQISPMARLQTHFSPLNNYFFAPWPGVYIYRLDNSSSWFTSVRCFIRLRILPPSTLKEGEKLCF